MASNNCCGGLQDDTVGGDGGSNIDGDNGDNDGRASTGG